MRDLEALIKYEKETIEDLSKEYENFLKMLKKARGRLDKYMMEYNKDNLKSMAWLIKNPTSPGAEKATTDWFEENYGGTFKGPHPSGYVHDDDFKPIQLNVEFSLTDYGDGNNKETCIANCKHFVENYMEFFEPYQEVKSRFSDKFAPMDVVPFQFASSQGGLTYLGYNPDNKTWYCFTRVYSQSDVTHEFRDFADAIEFAYVKSQEKEEEDNGYW
jgi:hypothetical protein